ncbi:hypothetical protein HF521_005548 [Silurus meridionalis]|uniref:Uncharacterized protein n=1 Tax=Silurus meridionalis TaxID=175797 RepID=A0A8T0AV35_SILME|nr:hypothetical protein HF521_005548 [Silurus meridionalis]
MGLPWLLALELVLHAGSFMCGVITAASVTITQGHFAGQCILYGSISFNTSDQSLTIESSSSPSLCYFVSSISEKCVAERVPIGMWSSPTFSIGVRVYSEDWQRQPVSLCPVQQFLHQQL